MNEDTEIRAGQLLDCLRSLDVNWQRDVWLGENKPRGVMELPDEWRYEFIEDFDYAAFVETLRGEIRSSIRALILQVLSEFKAIDKKLSREHGPDWTHSVDIIRGLTEDTRWLKLCTDAQTVLADIEENGWEVPKY